MARRRPAATVALPRARPPKQSAVYEAVDHGRPVLLRQADFAQPSRTGSWGTFAESFLRFNERPLRDLDIRADLVPSNPEPAIQLTPGGRTGAVPLRSAQTGAVVTGIVVKPRFGWPGVGAVMSEIGWAASPEFLELPLVPGSARHVPPWVLAGPVLFRLQALLQTVAPAYAAREEILRAPRGQVVWGRYLTESLSRGAWHRIPCCFPDLGVDPAIRSYIKWAAERVRLSLLSSGGVDHVANALVRLATQLLAELGDVSPRRPPQHAVLETHGTRVLAHTSLRDGLQALGWIVDERGLGGGREMAGLAWQLQLEELWERYVESIVRAEIAREGGEIAVGRLGQTTFPLHWSSSAARSMTQLVPDILVRRGRSVRIVDAKYKAHFADLDEHAWMSMADTIQAAHRADVHQVLAYASLYDAEEISASLIYPLRWSTWEALAARGRERSRAELFHGNRRVTLELRGVPFGRASA